MATVYPLLPTAVQFYEELQRRNDAAEAHRRKRFLAVVLLQRMTRGYLIRKHVAWLAKNATIIQSAYRRHMAKKLFRLMLQRAVQEKHAKHYNIAANRIQALWRGHYSRRVNFWYAAYRRWLAAVTERGERKAAEAAEFGLRSRADDLKILEEEARQWLAFVVFKLHHLLRTAACAGVYSLPATTELSDFEKLLKSINYTEYMTRLRRKYNEFVRKHRPTFCNKRLFPVIGEGNEYWYMSLADMYEMTKPLPKQRDTRHSSTHHGPQHTKPFLWKRVGKTVGDEKSTPVQMSKVILMKNNRKKMKETVCPSPTPLESLCGGDAAIRDPRFNLYCRYYTPEPDLLNYVDFHINALLKRKNSIENIEC